MTSLKDRLPATIRTERLVLTTPTMAHAPAIARLANNRNVHKWMARLPFPYSEDDARFFIDTVVPDEAELCYAMLRDGTEFIGITGLHFAAGEAPELGYWLGEPYWGRGFATEAASAAVDAARVAGIPALRSQALKSNAGSRNVLRKVGFIEIGEAIEAENNLAGQVMVRMRQEFSR